MVKHTGFHLAPDLLEQIHHGLPGFVFQSVMVLIIWYLRKKTVVSSWALIPIGNTMYLWILT